MELINHSTENRKVKLVRFADVKVNGGASGNGVSDVFMVTLFSAATSDGVVPSSISPGIELRDATNGKPTPYVQKVQVGPNPCSPTANVDLTKAFLFAPGSLELIYDLGGNDMVVPANGKTTLACTLSAVLAALRPCPTSIRLAGAVGQPLQSLAQQLMKAPS